MFGPHQIDGNPTIDVSVRPILGLPLLCCEATVYHFQDSRNLHTHQPVNGGNKGREVSTLLEACLHVHLLHFLGLLQTRFWCLFQMVLGICVNVVHVVNTVSPIISEVMDQEVTLLFRGL